MAPFFKLMLLSRASRTASSRVRVTVSAAAAKKGRKTSAKTHKRFLLKKYSNADYYNA
jgi:hypothetical protein